MGLRDGGIWFEIVYLPTLGEFNHLDCHNFNVVLLAHLLVFAWEMLKGV